jgi:hypothetical protein
VYLDGVTADSRSPATPIAIRITRPYATEDEYLEHEVDTLTRASITLVGAQPRAEGVVLRFEVVLPSGHVLIRGEGRVVGFKANAHQGAGGLSLRFTRLDTRSKALVDRAAGLRERRRPSMRPSASEPPIASMPPAAPRLSAPPLRASVPPPSRPPVTRTPPPLPVAVHTPVEGRLSSVPPPLPAAARIATHTPARSITPEPPRVAPPPPRMPQPVAPLPARMQTPVPPRMATPPPPPREPAPMPPSLAPPPALDPRLAVAAPRIPNDMRRDVLLERLRERARRLDPAFLANLLDPTRWSS